MKLKWLLLVALAVPAVAIECDKGCMEYQGSCACEKAPEKAPDVFPSDEAPPRSGRPSYEANGIHVDDAKSTAGLDDKRDKEIIKADTEGKLAAGIPVGK